MRRGSRLIRILEFEEPTINLTPLIDVVFVILIAFIIIAPLLELERIELAEGSKDGLNYMGGVQEVSPIAIHVKANNSIVLNSMDVTLDELSENLKKLKIQFPQVKPQLFQDRKAYFGTYQSIKNAAESAGFQQLDLILNPS